MKTEQNREEDYVAYHEAGHAVVAYALGREFDGITIVPNEKQGNLGCVDSTRPHDVCLELGAEAFRLEQLKYVEDEITQTLAGAIAQANAGFDVDPQQVEPDEMNACELAERLCKTESLIKACVEWHRRRAELILGDDRYNHALEGLAQHLLSNKQADYAEAVLVIEACVRQWEEFEGGGQTPDSQLV